MINPNDNLEREFDISIMSSLSTVQKDNLVNIIVLNITDHPVTINRDKELAKFAILTADQTDKLTPIDPNLLNVAYSMGPQHFESTINQLIRDENFVGPLQPPKPEPDYKTFWFPTPETCDDPSQLTPIQREIYDQILRLKQLETRDPRNNEKDRREFLDQFPWDKSVLPLEQRAEVQQLLIKYHDIFAKHRFDIGYNTEFKVNLTPEHDQPVYTQGPPTPIHLRHELHVQLALFQYFGLITTLPYSKYSSPLFAQRKSNGKLRLLSDLRRINHLLRNDYHNSNFPIPNMHDAINHFAGKRLFTKLDCSQAYHCVQMADETSVQLLAFNFSSRTYAYQRLAMGLSKSVTGFSSFIRHYLDGCLAAGLCTQFMDDIGSAVSSFEELIPALDAIFTAIRRSGLKLVPEKCEIATASMQFLGNVISENGITPESERIMKFLAKIRLPRTVKQVKRLIGFVEFFS